MAINPRFQELAASHLAALDVTWHLNAAGHVTGLRNRGAKGNGAIAMRELCALADATGTALALATSVAKLKPYYAGFGFRPTHEHRNGDYCATLFHRRPIIGASS